ncbi:MAG: ATP-grasp domain-containing protein [Gammaproteobacteria bacterium]|nr:ATP-grasp domain-containing protein [Gammaproteobacteria bacterium]MCP5196080.1 ATP-grasp domain-containing protein [Gammaproteobacteria bacterium]
MTWRVLLTRGLSNVRDAVALIHQAMTPGEFHLGVTYCTEHTPLRQVADSFHLELTVSEADTYVEEVLELCRQQDFGWIWPQSRWSLWLQAQDRFTAAGIRSILPCPDIDTLEVLQDKARVNDRLVAAKVPLPHSIRVTTGDEFNAALAELGGGARKVCIKPVQSIYGLGFRVIDDLKRPFDRLLSNDFFAIGSADFADLLDAAAGERPFLAMEYLTGDERSIDCLAWHGRLVRAVTRRKPSAAQGRWQIIEEDPASWSIAADVVREFQLHGLVNVQTRERLHADGHREPCFLEVNARMSGGIDMACQAGLNLPYWLLRLVTATTEEAHLPWPASGLRVAKIEQAVTLNGASA